jgi:WD40 repeat protein
MQRRGASADGRVALLWGRLPGETGEGLVVWDVPAKKRLMAVTGPDGQADVRLSRDGRRLVLESRDEPHWSLRVWDTADGRLLQRLDSQGIANRELLFLSYSLSFSPGGGRFAFPESRGGKACASVWDMESGTRLANLEDVGLRQWAGERLLVTCGPSRTGDSRVEPHSWKGWQTGGVKKRASLKPTHDVLWEVNPGVPSGLLDAVVESLSFSRDGSRLVTNQVVWDVARREGRVALRRQAVPDEEVFPVFRGDDELWWTDLPTSEVKKDVTVGRFGQGKRKVVVPSPGYPDLERAMNERMAPPEKPAAGWRAVPDRSRLEFGPDGKTFLLASSIIYQKPEGGGGIGIGEKCLELWDAAGPKRLALWDTSTEWKDFRYTPDGRRVVAGEKNGRLAVWDAARGVLERDLALPSCVLFGKVTARLFEVGTGAELRSWPVDGAAWRVAAFGRSAAHIIASGGDDGTVRLWDAASGRELAHWHAHQSRVTALAFSPDGDLLVSGGDGTVKLWDLPAIRKELAALGLDW